MATRNTVVLRDKEGVRSASTAVGGVPGGRKPKATRRMRSADPYSRDRQEARALFRQVERALDAFEPAPAKQQVQRAPAVTKLMQQLFGARACHA
jgi:hypothetical protein